MGCWRLTEIAGSFQRLGPWTTLANFLTPFSQERSSSAIDTYQQSKQKTPSNDFVRMSTTLASRVTGGGITKRSSGARLRVDRDGDLDMDAPAGGRGRGRGNHGSRTRRGGRGMNLNGAPTGQGADRYSKARSGSGSGALRARPPSNRDPIGTRSRGVTRSSGSKRNHPSGSGPVVGVRVRGWKNSQASPEECIRFLQRKTNLKFQKVRSYPLLF
jgi:hypothetical protein